MYKKKILDIVNTVRAKPGTTARVYKKVENSSWSGKDGVKKNLQRNRRKLVEGLPQRCHQHQLHNRPPSLFCQKVAFWYLFQSLVTLNHLVETKCGCRRLRDYLRDVNFVNNIT